MQTFLIERTIPPSFDVADPAMVARHARWAMDAYMAEGCAWLGGVVTPTRMLSLAAAPDAEALERYRRSLGIGVADFALSPVVRFLGPTFAEPAGMSAGPRVDTPSPALKSGRNPKGSGRQARGGELA